MKVIFTSLATHNDNYKGKGLITGATTARSINIWETIRRLKSEETGCLLKWTLETSAIAKNAWENHLIFEWEKMLMLNLVRE